MRRKINIIGFWIIFILLLTIFSFWLLKRNPAWEIKKPAYQRVEGDYNVILLIVNMLRPDHLGCYGYPGETSPAIDSLAQESFIFKNAFSQTGVTLPSVVSIFTSLYPESQMISGSYENKLNSNIQAMPEILEKHGYRTAWFARLSDEQLNINKVFGQSFDYTGELDRVFIGTENLFSWIENNKNNKFFIAMDIKNLQIPYLPISKYKDRFIDDDKGRIIENKEDLDRALYFKIMELLNTPGTPIYHIFDKKTILSKRELFNGEYERGKVQQIKNLLPPLQKHRLEPLIQLVSYFDLNLSQKDSQKYLMSLYDGCILGIDQELIKPLISKLKELDLYDKTLIIITADRGDGFGEHDRYGHRMELYDEIIHIPLIIRVPHYNRRQIIKALVQNIDIMPTMFELLGIETPDYIQGTSLIPLMENKKTNIHRYVYGGNSVCAYLRSLEWKLIYLNKKLESIDELYYLKEDPRELYNVCYRYPEIYQILKNKIEGFKDTLPLYRND